MEFRGCMYHSSGTNTGLSHFKELNGCKIGEEDAEEHKSVPDVVTVSTVVEITWVISLRASLHVYVDSSKIRGSKESDVRHRG